MTKIETFTAIEQFMNGRGLSLDEFYSVEIRTSGTYLQGHFKTKIITEIGADLFSISPDGYAVAKISLPIDSADADPLPFPIPVEFNITLT